MFFLFSCIYIFGKVLQKRKCDQYKQYKMKLCCQFASGRKKLFGSKESRYQSGKHLYFPFAVIVRIWSKRSIKRVSGLSDKKHMDVRKRRKKGEMREKKWKNVKKVEKSPKKGWFSCTSFSHRGVKWARKMKKDEKTKK